MTVFTRVPFWYWSDRVGVLCLFLLIGALMVGAGVRVAQSGSSVDRWMVYMIPVGIAMLVPGLWFFSRPTPIAVEIDAKEIRVQYQPEKTLTIARKDFVRAELLGMSAYRAYGILYRDGDTMRTAVIGHHFVGQDGTAYPRTEIIDAINNALGVK